MKKGILIALVCLLVAVTGVGIYAIKGENICKNVYVKGINVGGLTKEDAKSKLEKEYEMDVITFKYQSKSWKLEPSKVEMTYDIDKTIDNAYMVNRDKNVVVNIFNGFLSTVGAKKEINVVVDLNKEKVKEELQEIAKEIDVEVKNATLKVDGEKITTEKEKEGLKLEIDKTIKKLVDTVKNGKFEEELIVTKIEPEVVSSDLENIDTLLGSYSTVLVDSTPARVENIKLACSSNNDLIIMPDEEFSYNEHTGDRSKENGYKSAHVIQGGEVTNGVGGGICQVSSTMFNTVLYAGLEIVSRTNHSIPSDYVGLGRDATVSDYGTDFIFKNSLKNPVFIKSYCDGKRVYCQIFGHKSDKQNIEISAVVNAVISNNTIETKDPNLEEGVTEVIERGRVGRRVTTYRIYYDKDGKEINKELVCSSYYPAKNKEVKVGTKKKEQTQPENPGGTGGNGGTEGGGGTAPNPPSSEGGEVTP